ncbi:sugar phosphate isomerase/epimerase family protein [Demequina litorisediminis]|uniref:sugar phosphate isomerase/epimerase family protein n=1 Tax=Demequina litorisediminis TaxID=1849022 RepID=UPI0024E17E89|nr:hypothetical protein [Demequina litorisediminis]
MSQEAILGDASMRPGQRQSDACHAHGDACHERVRIAAARLVAYDTPERTPVQRARMLHRMGLTGIVWDWREEHTLALHEELDVLAAHDIEVRGLWCPLPLPATDAHLGEIDPHVRVHLDEMTRRGLTPDLWTCVEFGDEGRPERLGTWVHRARVIRVADHLEPLTRRAADAGMRVALTNHLGWFGEPEHQIEVIHELAGRGLTNVGLAYQMQHGHTHVDRFDALMETMAPHLLALALSGIDADGVDTGRKILPWGAGRLDRRLAHAVMRSGWHGQPGCAGALGGRCPRPPAGLDRRHRMDDRPMAGHPARAPHSAHRHPCMAPARGCRHSLHGHGAAREACEARAGRHRGDRSDAHARAHLSPGRTARPPAAPGLVAAAPTAVRGGRKHLAGHPRPVASRASPSRATPARARGGAGRRVRGACRDAFRALVDHGRYACDRHAPGRHAPGGLTHRRRLPPGGAALRARRPRIRTRDAIGRGGRVRRRTRAAAAAHRQAGRLRGRPRPIHGRPPRAPDTPRTRRLSRRAQEPLAGMPRDVTSSSGSEACGPTTPMPPRPRSTPCASAASYVNCTTPSPPSCPHRTPCGSTGFPGREGTS